MNNTLYSIMQIKIVIVEGLSVVQYFLDSRFIYEQVEDLIMDNIKNGTWPVHSKLKDEIKLSEELGVSRGTLRKAIKSVVEKGLLTQIKGKGTFVASSDIEQPLASRFVSFSEALKQKNISYKTIVLKKQIISPGPKIAAFLEIDLDTEVFLIERVRLVDNMPVIYLKNYVHLACCPDIINDDFENETLFSLIENKYRLKIIWGRRIFKAITALGDAARNLGLEIGAPVMYLEQNAYTKGNKPVEYSTVWINSDRFDLVSTIQR